MGVSGEDLDLEKVWATSLLPFILDSFCLSCSSQLPGSTSIRVDA